jgi:hypothetical protein
MISCYLLGVTKRVSGQSCEGSANAGVTVSDATTATTTSGGGLGGGGGCCGVTTRNDGSAALNDLIVTDEGGATEGEIQPTSSVLQSQDIIPPSSAATASPRGLAGDKGLKSPSRKKVFSDSGMINLNVGGKIFTTTINTLLNGDTYFS